MFKFISLVLASLFCVATLPAQTEPHTDKKPLGDATPPPQVHKPSKPPTGDKIPPPASVPVAQGSGDKCDAG